MLTWVYVLRLTRKGAVAAPTAAESHAIDCHFDRLQKAFDAGTVHLAGPTLDGEFGLVIFDAEDEEAARRFAAEDPSVQAGVMSAELHPFRMSLGRRPCP
jgi:uncharacterized protein YciI